jgi:hypothetical protein
VICNAASHTLGYVVNEKNKNITVDRRNMKRVRRNQILVSECSIDCQPTTSDASAIFVGSGYLVLQQYQNFMFIKSRGAFQSLAIGGRMIKPPNLFNQIGNTGYLSVKKR